MKLSRKQQTPELFESINAARVFGSEAHRHGIRRCHDDAAVIDLARNPQFDHAQRAEIYKAWMQGATKAMFAGAGE